MVWFLAVNVLSTGDAAPLPYVPLASPLDLTLALALWALGVWAARFADISERALYRWIGAGLFVALNGIVLRAAHHWGHIPWRLSSLLASKPLQAALTLAWTATALASMFVATKRGMRPLWMLGAGLLALVVGKLFLVDLGALSGLPRVAAFVGVGILLLVIGYLSPLPPTPRADATAGWRTPAGVTPGRRRRCARLDSLVGRSHRMTVFHVRKHARHTLLRHLVRRIARSGDRLRRRRLPSGSLARGGRHPA